MTNGSTRRVTALLLLPATLWFLVLLVLPLVVILVYSLGERAPEGGYAPALTLAQYANLPARWTAFQNTLTLAPLGTLLTLLAAYPAGLLAGAALPAALAAVPAGAGDRAVLDQPARSAPMPGSSSWAGAGCRRCWAGWAWASRA